MFLLTLMVISYFKNLSKLRKPHFWKWFLIGMLLLNLTESTLFRSASFSGWVFVLSYLALHVELLHSRGLVFERVWGGRPRWRGGCVLVGGPGWLRGMKGVDYEDGICTCQ